MQSGISASQELQTALQSLLTSSSQRGLLATISNEQIIPGSTISTSSSNFLSDLSNLTPHIKPNEALYILLRRADDLNSSDKSLAAVTYVPNSAPVRQKMLFASTRLTLVRELGGEHFSESIFCTEAEELTSSGWEKHQAHTESANPLTAEEESLQGIKDAEALESRGTRGQGLAQGGRLAIRADAEIAQALQQLGSGSGENLVQLRMDAPTETLQLASVSSATPGSLSTTIEKSEPRFSFYRHNDAGSTILFISTCPSVAKIKERMLYAASRSNVLGLAQSDGGLKVGKKIEATNPEEITSEVVEEEVRGKVEAPEGDKKAFAKPKRPGRR